MQHKQPKSYWNMKRLATLALWVLMTLTASAQLSPLHVEGRYIKDEAGNIVNLHGFAQTYSPWFNERGTKWNNYDVNGCLNYNKGIIDMILQAGWQMDFVRMHMDPYWSNTPGKQVTGENDISAFSMQRFKKYLDEVFIPMAEYAIGKGLYVVMRPPGVCPETISVGGPYFNYLMQVWDYVSQHQKLRDNPGILFELANEPVGIVDSNGQTAGTEELARFMQPIVDKMREHCQNILLIPGLGWQSQYAGFVDNPIEGENIGYAVHCYPGWYNGGHGDDNVIVNYEDFHKGWEEQITPASNMAPIIVTEMDWAPNKYNSSWGRSFTGVSGGEGFGANFRKLADECGNIGWLLFTSPELLAQFKDEAPSDGNYTFLTDPEACPWACYHWFKEYAAQRQSEEYHTLTSVTCPTTTFTLLPRTTKALHLTATFADGHEINVAGDAEYTVSNEHVATVRGGNLLALQDGETDISAKYTDPQGTVHTFQLTVKVTMFPLTADVFNPSIWEQGTFDESTGTLRTGTYGFGGWQYGNGLDLSPYKYLVVELNKRQNCGASFRLFDINNYWSDPYMKDFGSSTKLQINLQNMVSNNGRQLDPSHIYIIGIWSYGGSDISIKNVFVSNDGSTPAAIDQPTADLLSRSVYTINGLKAGTTEQMDALPRGIYIVNGKKHLKP